VKSATVPPGTNWYERSRESTGSKVWTTGLLVGSPSGFAARRPLLMSLGLFSGTANLPLSEAISAELRVPLGRRELARFPDGEIHVELHDSVRGQDVYLIQPTGPPVAEHLLELLLLADASRRAGSERLTAVIPYFGYARQDRRAHGREPVGARLVADLLRASGVDRVVGVDMHTRALEGFFSIPLEHLSAVSLLAEAARAYVGANSVVVAPDLGATKLAERYATILGLPVAIVHKTRLSGHEVSVRTITGEVRDLAPLLVDDIISTGGTIAAAVDALLAAGCVPDVTVLASHALLVGSAVDRLAGVAARRLITTDSLSISRTSALTLAAC
jgi:ribose-phosphate pyrophosphokinase